MTIWLKTLSILAVAFALVGTPNAVMAGCGACGGDAGHKHEKATCTKCDHAKTCTAADCSDKAHKAECTCPKKEDSKAKSSS